MKTRIITEEFIKKDKVFLENENLEKYDDETLIDWASECDDDIYLETQIGDNEVQNNIYEYYNNIYNKIPENIRNKLEKDEWYVHLSKSHPEWICFQKLIKIPVNEGESSEIESLIIDLSNNRFYIYDWFENYKCENIEWIDGIENIYSILNKK